MSLMDVICDNANQDLDQVPITTYQMSNLKMLYLENNRLTSLPADFFYRLPLINWLDLRNNQLATLPASIEFHSFLENLLLQNNKIVKLPNELGLVPNLKVLQLNGNPLQYPSQEIIQSGVQKICGYLKQEYCQEQFNLNQNIYLQEPIAVSAKISSTSSTSTTSNNNKPSMEEVRQNIHKRLTKNRPAKHPLITVKSLSKIHQKKIEKHQQNNTSSKKDKYPVESELPNTSNNSKSKRNSSLPSSKKVHKIVSEQSKLSVKSQYNINLNNNIYVQSTKDVDDIGENVEQIPGQQLKDLWLTNLKVLLQDQEKIIQQERNLNVLNDWRQEKKSEPIREYDSDALVSIPPYDINPEYSRIPSRSDLSKHLDKVICCDKNKNKNKKQVSRNVDVQRLINNLIKQLQEIEASSEDTQGITPRRKLESTEKEIRMIMDVQKKISTLQNQN